MNSKAKGVVALILAVAVLANVGIFAKMSYNKTHTAQETIVFRVGDRCIRPPYFPSVIHL